MDQFFVDQKGRPIMREQFCKTLSLAVKLVLGKSTNYASHSVRIGGAVHLYLSSWTVDQIMAQG